MYNITEKRREFSNNLDLLEKQALKGVKDKKEISKIKDARIDIYTEFEFLLSKHRNNFYSRRNF